MNWGLAVLLLANAIFIVAWIWASITMSLYIKKGKGSSLFLNPYLMFSKNTFTDEGQPYFRKARITLGTSFLLLLLAVIFLECFSK
jgi:hypothetical protein